MAGVWDQLVDCICRPPRDIYRTYDLIGGEPGLFMLKGMEAYRKDFELHNKDGLVMKCSHFIPTGVQGVGGLLPCVVYCHCNSGSRRDAEEAVYALIPMGVSVFCFDFTGSGLSEGQWVTLGAHEVEDLEVVVEYLRSTSKVSNIMIWGRSMGAVTALLYTKKDPAIAGIVVDSPFSKLTDLMTEIVQQQKLPIPRVMMKMAVGFMRKSVRKRAHFDISAVSPIDVVTTSVIPVVFGHGMDDAFIPPHHSQRLADAYGSKAQDVYKNVVKFEGDHNQVRPPWFYDSVAAFCAQHLDIERQLVGGNPLMGAMLNNGAVWQDGDSDVDSLEFATADRTYQLGSLSGAGGMSGGGGSSGVGSGGGGRELSLTRRQFSLGEVYENPGSGRGGGTEGSTPTRMPGSDLGWERQLSALGEDVNMQAEMARSLSATAMHGSFNALCDPGRYSNSDGQPCELIIDLDPDSPFGTSRRATASDDRPLSRQASSSSTGGAGSIFPHLSVEPPPPLPTATQRQQWQEQQRQLQPLQPGSRGNSQRQLPVTSPRAAGAAGWTNRGSGGGSSTGAGGTRPLSTQPLSPSIPRFFCRAPSSEEEEEAMLRAALQLSLMEAAGPAAGPPAPSISSGAAAASYATASAAPTTPPMPVLSPRQPERHPPEPPAARAPSPSLNPQPTASTAAAPPPSSTMSTPRPSGMLSSGGSSSRLNMLSAILPPAVDREVSGSQLHYEARAALSMSAPQARGPLEAGAVPQLLGDPQALVQTSAGSAPAGALSPAGPARPPPLLPAIPTSAAATSYGKPGALSPQPSMTFHPSSSISPPPGALTTGLTTAGAGGAGSAGGEMGFIRSTKRGTNGISYLPATTNGADRHGGQM